MQEIKLPQLGQSVEEASIVKWYKNEGDPVKVGEVLFSVQTDKAEIECESTAEGVLRKILVPPDELIPVMTVVALVGDPNEPLPEVGPFSEDKKQKSQEKAQVTAIVSDNPVVVEQKTGTPSDAEGVLGGVQKAISPRARRRAEELGLNTAEISGSGVKGRVLSEDVDAYAHEYFAHKATPTARKLAEARGVDLATVKGSGVSGKIMKEDVLRAGESVREMTIGENERRIPLSPMRRIIAQRMAASMFTSPHYYVTVEVDMTRTVHYRQTLGAFKPSFNTLVMYATTKALQQVPQVNARWDEDAIAELADVNLGFAVALPSGLVVPVVRKVQTKSLQELDEEARLLTEKARSGKLLPDDYSGSTFTISNLGSMGVDQFTAIINPPNSAILAVGRIHEKPVAINGGVFVRPMMNMTLSSDHRVIDGALAARFMGVLREILEKADF